MSNPVILKLMSSLLNGKTSVNGKVSGSPKLLKPGKGSRHFLSDMIKAFHVSNHSDDEPVKVGEMSNNKGYKYYLDHLKKELLSQGKPLDKTFIKEKDLPLVKTFLLQCGFSHEKVERFIKDLKTNRADGQITLSQIFLRISELETPERKEHQNETVSPAIIPYIESILRDFNLTSKELDSTFSKARIEGGGLDLHKLIAHLKEIKSRSPLASKTVVDQKLSRQISDKMETIGLNIPKNEKAEQISLEDFISSMKQMMENMGKEKKVSPGIRKTLGKILERVELLEDKVTSTPSVKVSSKYNFTDSLLKEEIRKKDNHVFNEKVVPSLEKSKSSKNASISSFLKQKDDKVQNPVGPNTDVSNYSKKTDLMSDLNKKIELIIPVKEKGYRVDKEVGQINVSRNTDPFNFTNTLRTVEQGEKPFRGYLPTTLVDQVGKQISRSILRGDRVVTLQLKPPDLGTIRIKMDIKDRTLKLGMIADHHSVKELLINNVHELKESLVQQGVKLEKLDVQVNSNSGQSLNASKEGTDSKKGWRKNYNGERFHSDNHTEGLHERAISIVSGSNLLDLVA
ncbi:MAG: flagellar hook-length control protein FliK [Deltaproteobacteria bacterium]|nr:flagellar hook-length control protein FliK [Deltaproteobacteria bacterium]